MANSFFIHPLPIIIFAIGFSFWMVELIPFSGLLCLGLICVLWAIFSLCIVRMKPKIISMHIGNIFNVVSFDYCNFQKKSKWEIEFYNEKEQLIWSMILDEGFEDDELIVTNHGNNHKIKIAARSREIFVFIFNTLR